MRILSVGNARELKGTDSLKFSSENKGTDSNENISQWSIALFNWLWVTCLIHQTYELDGITIIYSFQWKK